MSINQKPISHINPKQSGLCFRKLCNPQHCLTRTWVFCVHNQCIACGPYTDNYGITRFSVFLLHVKKRTKVCTWRGVGIFTYFQTKSVKGAIPYRHVWSFYSYKGWLKLCKVWHTVLGQSCLKMLSTLCTRVGYERVELELWNSIHL